ncbi:MAG: DUF1501 domain-containing protein, partial [Gammaproteobacteria bacterium]|nr:DUF1501 domain-containing protein [Gammaproteobacteria bacterium]
MKRRNFLRTLGMGTGAAMASVTGGSMFRFAQAQVANPKILIVVFQRGGCDGLNTVVPYGDGEYYNLRPSIRILPPSANAQSAIDLDGFFGLHPGLAPFKPLYDSGVLAVMPATHYPDASRSHFDGQDNLESGGTEPEFGWLNRYLEVSSGAGMRAIGVGGSLPHALKGNEVVSVFDNLTSFTLDLPPDEEQFILQRIAAVYGQTADPTKRYRELLHTVGRTVVNDLATINSIADPNSYQPEFGANYPGTRFGRQLRQTAQLIKEGLGLEVASLGLGGWDTHDGQGGAAGRQADLHADFAGSIAAFYQDLGARTSDVVILTMTEFGRTARENG